MIITNFNKDKERLYREAVRLFNNKDLYVDRNAYDRYRNRLDGRMALRAKYRMDLSEFWRIFDRLESEIK